MLTIYWIKAVFKRFSHNFSYFTVILKVTPKTLSRNHYNLFSVKVPVINTKLLVINRIQMKIAKSTARLADIRISFKS